MKKFFMLTPLFFMMMSEAHAVKFIIYTDQDDMSKANEVAETMKNTYPFNKNKVEFEVMLLNANELDCGSRMKNSKGEIMQRTVTCDNTEKLNALTAQKGADQAMIVKSLDYNGGSSYEGGIPVMTTGSHPRVMIHEYMHTLGLCDEYEYPAEEANIYCESMFKKPNAVVIEPLPYYLDDRHARREHMFDIPWFSGILETTKITTGTNLGTGMAGNEKEVPNNSTIPSVLNEPIGLYQGKTCKNSTPPKKTWVPGGRKTIMDDYEAGLGAAMEQKVDEILRSKGAQPKMEYTQPTSTTARGESSLPDVAIYDAPRNPFKDFFQAIGSFFSNLFKTISR